MEKKVFDWIDSKIDYKHETNINKSMVKALCNGFIKGCIRTTVISGSILVSVSACAITVNRLRG